MLRLLSATSLAAASYNFITLGDWGGGTIDSYDHEFNPNVTVWSVAAQMAKTAKTSPPAFIVNTGDNFYWCGLQNTSDYQIEEDFIKPYSAAELDVEWYTVLGNHEYGYNVQAQIDYGKINKKWVIDDRYYTRRVQMAPGHGLTMIFIDTSPCVADYRAESNARWDPCGKMYPTCSLSSSDDDYEGKCGFHEHIMTQDCGKQFTWFKKQLAAVPKDDWLIVVGHHAIDEVDVEDFATALQQHGFDLYLNGHAHTLSHYTIDRGGAYVTSGAGAMVNTEDQHAEHIVLKTSGAAEVISTANNNHSYQTVWNSKTPGFTTHSFEANFTTLTTTYVTFDGKTPHTFTVRRGESPVPSPPTPKAPTPPAPPTPPTPAGSGCCYSKDDSSACAKGSVCCKSGCSDPGSCSYTETGCSGEYGKKHHCTWQGGKCVVGGGFGGL